MTEHDTIAAGRLSALFEPASVAVVGASADPTKTGGRPIHYLQKHGYEGRIYPINPKADRISGLPSLSSVADLPEAPDVAIVLLGAERAAGAVRELAQRGTKLAIVLASGFGEAGVAGAAREDELLTAAGDMRILGPNTIGAMDVGRRFFLSASGALEGSDLPVGGVSVASQSGGILGSLLSRAAARGIGFSRLASTGNEVDIEVADLIENYVDDERTRVIAAYIEGIRSVEKFRRATERAREAGKAVVAYKVGRSETGARAAVSHTGAMAGEDRVYDALFRQTGVIRAQTFGEFLDIPAMLTNGRRMRGSRVAVLTSSGGAGSLVADNCGLHGLDLPTLDEATAARLQEILCAGEPQAANPVDVTLAGVRPEIMTAAAEALLASDGIDGVAVVVGSSALAQPEIAVNAIRNGAAKSDKPLIAYVSPEAPHLVRELNAQGIPAYAAPESCAAAFKAAMAGPDRDSDDTAGAQVATIHPLDLPSGPLNEAEASALFARFGLRSAEHRVVADAQEAERAASELGGRLVLKVLDRNLSHKSDIGGVRLSLSQGEVAEALGEMRRALARSGAAEPEGFLVQRMLKGGTEMILGLRRDPQLGPLVLLGAGGTLAELSEDVAIRLLPITRHDARAMVAELRMAPILEGYRGEQPRDVGALVDAVLALAGLGEALGERLGEAEINPLFVQPDGEGVVAADALVVLRPAP